MIKIKSKHRECCTKVNLWITCAHNPGSGNVIAYFESRTFIDAEWKPNPKMFSKAIEKLQLSNIDCFASRINAQIDKYISCKPDPYTFLLMLSSLTGNQIIVICSFPFSGKD